MAGDCPALVVIVVPNYSPCLPGVLPSRSDRLEVERLRLAWSFGGDVVMPDRQVLRFIRPGRQVLRTTDLPKTSSCVGW